MNYAPSDPWGYTVPVSDSTGNVSNVDDGTSVTITIRRNGADDTSNWAISVVSNVGTGQYYVTGTVYSLAVAGDLIEPFAQYQINGITVLVPLEKFRLLAGVVITSGSGALADVATAVWQDATAGDFTVANSIGKSLYTANVAPGESGGHLISGSNAGTTTLGALTVTGATTFTGAVVGSNASNNFQVNLTQWLGTAPGALVAGNVRSDVERWGTVAVASPINGRIQVDVEAWNATAVATPAIAGVPIVDFAYLVGTLQTAGLIQADLGGRVLGNTATAFSGLGAQVDVRQILGTASAGAAGYVGIDWSAINAPTAAVDLTQTTIKNLTGNTVQTGDSFARLGAPAGASIAADIAEVEAETDLLLAGVTVSAIAAGAITDAAFTVTDQVVGPATGFLSRLNQLWRRFFKKTTKNASGDGKIKTYADDNTTVLTTQTYIDSTAQEVDSA